MFWLFAQLFALCSCAFLAGAVLTWLRLRATIRDLRAQIVPPIARPAPPATAVVIPHEACEPEARDTDYEAEAAGAEAEAVSATAVSATTLSAEAVSAEVIEVEATGAEFSECAIKGSSKSMIFHTPASPYFKRMRGDVTFHSIAEAERAGYTQWRPRARAASGAR